MGDVSSIGDDELVRRVIAGCVKPVGKSSQPLWETVSRRFCLGSTYSRQLCERFGYDPEGPGKR